MNRLLNNSVIRINPLISSSVGSTAPFDYMEVQTWAKMFIRITEFILRERSMKAKLTEWVNSGRSKKHREDILPNFVKEIFEYSKSSDVSDPKKTVFDLSELLNVLQKLYREAEQETATTVKILLDKLFIHIYQEGCLKDLKMDSTATRKAFSYMDIDTRVLFLQQLLMSGNNPWEVILEEELNDVDVVIQLFLQVRSHTFTLHRLIELCNGTVRQHIQTLMTPEELKDLPPNYDSNSFHFSTKIAETRALYTLHGV